MGFFVSPNDRRERVFIARRFITTENFFHLLRILGILGDRCNHERRKSLTSEIIRARDTRLGQPAIFLEEYDGIVAIVRSIGQTIGVPCDLARS